jgi:hypothetical protein
MAALANMAVELGKHFRVLIHHLGSLPHYEHRDRYLRRLYPGRRLPDAMAITPNAKTVYTADSDSPRNKRSYESCLGYV